MFFPLNYVIFIFATRFLKLFAMLKDRGSLYSMVKSLRKVNFRTLLATIYENFCLSPPLEKILGAPLAT